MPGYGRVPSPPDPRDFKLEAFLGVDDPLIGLLKNLDAATNVAPATKKLFDALIPRFLTLESKVPNPPPPPTPVSKLWDKTQYTLNQGNTPHCVGFGWAQWGNTNPVADMFTDTDGHNIYYECKVIDGQPNQENGSYTRSGAKAMQARGRLSVYAFANTLDAALTWVLTKGPVVVGSDFYWDMETPDVTGLVHPTGGIAGGHEYLMVGYDGSDLITFLNSWGTSWGVKGYFKMHKSEFQLLFDQSGELCTSIEL